MTAHPLVTLAVIALTTLALAPPTAHGRSKFVSVSMFARWQSTSLLAEASEFLHQQSPSTFWQFLDNLAERKDLAGMSDSREYQLALAEADRLIPGSRSGLLRLSLSLRAASPALEMNAQLGAVALASATAAGAGCAAGDVADGFAVLPDGTVACAADRLATALATANVSRQQQLYRTDKIRPATATEAEAAPAVVLYARLASAGFPAWHVAMTTLAASGRLRYAFRHAPPTPRSPSPSGSTATAKLAQTRLSGYGVELAIKSTEYKAMDDSKVEGAKDDSDRHVEEDEVQGFLFSKLRALHANLTQELDQFKQHLLDSSTEIAPLKAWQLQDLSYQAAQRVLTVSPQDALHVLRDLSQNYPIRATALSKTAVLPSLRLQLEANQRQLQQQLSLPPGASLLMVNGRPVDLEFYDVYTMLQSLSEEASLMDAVAGLGVPARRVGDLLLKALTTSSAAAAAGGGEGAGGEKFALDFRDPAVVYVNDLEQSHLYSQWPRSLQDLLKPAFPGTMRRIARNLYNLVVFVDPATKESADLIRFCEAFVQHTVPIRIGLVWAPQDAVGRAMVRAFNFVRNDKGSVRPALSFLTDIYSVTFEQGYGLTLDFARQYFKGLYHDVDADETLGEASDYGDQLAAGQAFLARSGLSAAPAVLLNGALLDGAAVAASFEETVLTEIVRQTTELQREVAAGRLRDADNVVDFLNERPSVVKRLNQRLLHGGQALTLGQLADATSSSSSLRYFVKNDDAATRAVSLWLACDFASAPCRALAYEALRLVKGSAQLRLALVHSGDPALALARALRAAAGGAATGGAAASEGSAKRAVNLASKLCKPENWATVGGVGGGAEGMRDLAVHGMDWGAFAAEVDSPRTLAELKSLAEYAATNLGLSGASAAASVSLVTNGRLVGPLPEAELDPADLRLLERLALGRAGRTVAEALGELAGDGGGGDQSELAMRLSALLGSHPAASASASARRLQMPPGLQAGAVLRLEPATSSAAATPSFDVQAIVDPLSRDAQKMSHILLVLRQALNARVSVVFNCREKLSEPPLKTFYRYALSPEPTFAPADGSLSGGGVTFDGMPAQPLLTLGLDAPHNWIVEAVSSPHDLDNIKLANVASAGVHADYELEYLLVEGHCVDSATNQIPRGLQFTLGTAERPLQRDTIVMYNLGYFQLKAAPNAWRLRLREGKSADIYDIASHDNTDGVAGAGGDPVAVVDSFRSKVISVRVAKKPDRLEDSLLGDEPAQQTIWGSISK